MEKKNEETATEEKEDKNNEDTADEVQGRYLYFELLDLVDQESKNQLDELDKNINTLADEYKDDWNKLTKWDLPDEYERVRQDVIPNGIVSQYSYSQLSESSASSFNSPDFYDHHQYLSQLVILAQIVDDDFQQSIQKIFAVDKVTNEAIISFSDHLEGEEAKTSDDKHGDGKMKYLRGPVKLIERARAKAQNDYANETYPSSACVLDFNRCCLIFNDISTLLRAIKLFVNKVNYYQSGAIIGIVRDKNGFTEYVEDGVQYADIKLNVLIKGKYNNIIGEVQFLLQVMKEFKDKAHNLYAIQRRKEMMEESVSEILPLLLEPKPVLFTAALTSPAELCKLMVFNNMNPEDLIKVDEKTGFSMLGRACDKGQIKTFKFIQSITPKDKFIECVTHSNDRALNAPESVATWGNTEMMKVLLDVKEVRAVYQDKDRLYSLLYMSFGGPVHDLVDCVLSKLDINSAKFISVNTHDTNRKHKITLINKLITRQSMETLKKVVTIIGDKTFINQAFERDEKYGDVLECCIKCGKIQFTIFILSYNEIKEKYMKDKKLLNSILQCVANKFDKSIAEIIINAFELNEEKINELQEYGQFDTSNILGFCK